MSHVDRKVVPAYSMYSVDQDHNDDDIEMSPIEISNYLVSGEFVDACSSPQTSVETIENRVTTMTISEDPCDVNCIIDKYNGPMFPAHMIVTPAPSRSILRKISKYDSTTSLTSSIVVNDRTHNVPIITVLPSFTDSTTQGYPVKVRRMSSSGTPMSSAAAIIDHLKTALKMSSLKASLSAGSSAASSTTSLVEDDQSITVAPRTLRFNANVLVGETWHAEDYNRTPGEMIAKKLTAHVAMMVKKELNEFKSREMTVHEESRHHTVFYPL